VTNTRGGEFFFLPKRVKPLNYLHPLVRIRYGIWRHNNMILKQIASLK
jgi:hypothetical protein